MQIQENISLKQWNTFGIEVSARYFATFSDADSLAGALSNSHQLPVLILGGGSNILFTKNFNGLVAKNAVSGIELIKENEYHVYVRVGAGENWHRFVLYCIQRNWAGIENLSLIPGSSGAAPIQNIGAYGVEAKDVIDELEAYHISDKKVYTLSANDCEFGYRDSVFKGRFKDQFVILNVTFRLNKVPRFNTSYGAIEKELENMGVSKLTISAVSQAVINIRNSKLPDPAETGNAGSYFKNPVVAMARYRELRNQYPDIVGYEFGSETKKISAGWLVEQCGWKGFRRGDAGCYSKQALVLVNYGNASGSEISHLGEEIALSVKKKFGVTLVPEVNIL